MEFYLSLIFIGVGMLSEQPPLQLLPPLSSDEVSW